MFGLVFGGYFSLEEWVVSFDVWEEMKVYCGFVKGLMLGLGMGYDIDEENWEVMFVCWGVVVVLVIFGNYD